MLYFRLILDFFSKITKIRKKVSSCHIFHICFWILYPENTGLGSLDSVPEIFRLGQRNLKRQKKSSKIIENLKFSRKLLFSKGFYGVSYQIHIEFD